MVDAGWREAEAYGEEVIMPDEIVQIADDVGVSIRYDRSVTIWDTRPYSNVPEYMFEWAEALAFRDFINEQEAKDVDG